MAQSERRREREREKEERAERDERGLGRGIGRRTSAVGTRDTTAVIGARHQQLGEDKQTCNRCATMCACLGP